MKIFISIPIRGCWKGSDELLVFGSGGLDTETFNDQVLFTAQWGHYLPPNEAAKSTKFSKQKDIHQLQKVQKISFGP